MAEYIVGIADDSVQDVDRLHREYAVNGMIVRCEDCKYWAGNGANVPELPYWLPCKGVMREPDWFCADGEREDETEIIRCKDCKYFGVENRTCNYHETYFILVKPDNYCTHGEMKEQKEEDDP